MTKKARWPRGVAGPWWVPNIDLSQATALAVPVGQRYRQAIYAKLVRLLEQAGRPAAKAAVQGYLEAQEMDIVPLDFPMGWAEQILSSGTLPELLAMGNPEEAEPADSELTKEAIEGQAELSLEEFLAAAPS
jgi:hypothetical protein